VIEGYPLPRDPRLGTLIVTPDTGVIEVNVQPTSSWRGIWHLIETLHEQARLTRLGTEKFTLDGSHTGTGGGNHVTLGGATPADSPMLRRPDLLASMVTFWQHHPAVSYLFSGQFIGPTSQASRVDKGRVDTVYGLEIAFVELRRQGDDVPPWLVDRLLRHVLVDLTGNTHRSEFCVDKLFSPDSDRGRLGTVALRAFEMAPYPQMALVQSLLVRALVARFWDEPYAGRLVRWGTDLSDRYLLPWYVDLSVERMQVLVEGFNEARHILTCNGIPVPLHTTSTPGTGVAGIRFEAWAPWSALRPTIDAHGPLVFDLIDRWSSKSVGGCTYEVSHPAGRSYDTFQVNAAEAEARRCSRFFQHGHTPGTADVPELDGLAEPSNVSAPEPGPSPPLDVTHSGPGRC